MRYFSNAGPVRGPTFYHSVPDAIGVLESPTNNLPIGTALGLGPDDAGVALWCLNVHGVAVRGRWVIVDREFRSTP
jgi:hypothetical protein